MIEDSEPDQNSETSPIVSSNENSETVREYWAFISYRHNDNQQKGRQWASCLQKKLETYDIPEELIGTRNERGETVPDRIYPVFRDEEELSADSDLTLAIKTALDRSKFLIVICSPNAVASTYVSEEILYFKKLGRADRIIAVIIDGEPNISRDKERQQSLRLSPYQECFPEPLLFHLSENGELDRSKPTEPIAADFRLEGREQGWTDTESYRAFLTAQGTHKAGAIRTLVSDYERRLQVGLDKTIAGVLGIPLALINERGKAWELQKARKRARVLAAWLSLSAALAVVAIAAGIFGWLQLKEVQARKLEAEQNMTLAMANEDKANQHLKLAKENLELAEMNQAKAERNLEKAVANQQRAEKSEQEAGKLISFMTFELIQGLKDYVPGHVRQPMFEKLYQYHENQSSNLAEASTEQKRLLVAIDNEAGDKAIRDGKTENAAALYDSALKAAKSLSESDESNLQYRRDLGVGYEKMGTLQLVLGNTRQAKEYYEEALVQRQQLRDRDPANLQFIRDLSVIYDKLGDLNLRSGDFAAAERYFGDSLLLRNSLVERKPDEKQFQRDITISKIKLGDIQLVRYGNEEKAESYYQESLELRRGFVSRDENNTQFQRDLGVNHERLGDFYLQVGKPREAREHYNKALTIRRNLVALDQSNTVFRVDLSVCYERMADMNYAFRKYDEATGVLKMSIGNWEKLRKEDAKNSDLMRGVAVAYNKMGDIKLALKQFEAADEYFDKAWQINRELVKIDPGNMQFLRDISISLEKKGDLQMRLANFEAARDYYRKALEQSKALVDMDQSNTQLQRDLAVSHAKLGNSYYIAIKATKPELLEEHPALEDNDEAVEVATVEIDALTAENIENARVRYHEFLSIFRNLEKNNALRPNDVLLIDSFDKRMKSFLPSNELATAQ